MLEQEDRIRRPEPAPRKPKQIALKSRRKAVFAAARGGFTQIISGRSCHASSVPKKLVAPASRVVPPASWVVAPASRRLSRGHLARAPRPKKELPRFPTTKIALPRRARLLQLVQLRQHFPAMLRRIHAGKN